MIVANVNFNEEVIKTLSREKFLAMHINLLWQDRDEATRKKMLNEVYDSIVKPPKGKNNK